MRLVALLWFWVAAIGAVLLGWWPGGEFASIGIWIALSLGLYSFFWAVGFVWLDLPEWLARRRQTR
jgi:hypothetical protein